MLPSPCPSSDSHWIWEAKDENEDHGLTAVLPPLSLKGSTGNAVIPWPLPARLIRKETYPMQVPEAN